VNPRPLKPGEKNARAPALGEDAFTRPADAFLAEQAAHVTPRRDAFKRLTLTPEHAAHVPDVPTLEDTGAPTPVNAEAALPAHGVDAERLPFHVQPAEDAPEPARVTEAESDGVPPAPFHEADERPTPEFKLPDREAETRKVPRVDLTDKEA
jgi:hypothetical protein